MTLGPLDGAQVVDLFSGSGALGIEALSRGAAHVDFVEAGGVARRVLEANLGDLGIGSRATVWAFSLPRGLKRLSARLEHVDLVLMDPPYGGVLARATLEALGTSGAWKPGARVVVEHHRRDELPAATGRLVRSRERRYGETVVTTYVIGAAAGRADDRGDAA